MSNSQLPWLNGDMLPDGPVELKVNLVRLGNAKDKYFIDVENSEGEQFTMSSACNGVLAHQMLRQLEGATITVHKVKEKFINIWTQGENPKSVQTVRSAQSSNQNAPPQRQPNKAWRKT